MNIYRITNPQAFQHPQIRDFFLKGAEKCQFPDPAACLEHLAKVVPDPRVACYAVLDPDPKAFVVLMLPDGPFMLHPQALMVYSEHKPSFQACVLAAVEFAKANGYNKVWALNFTGLSDEGYVKLFSFVGKVTPKAMLMEFEF